MAEFEIDITNDIKVDPPKKKRGRPKKTKVQKKEPVIIEEPEVEFDIFETQSGSDDDMFNYNDFGLVDDNRLKLKKLFLNNKQVLKYLTLKRIDEMMDEDVNEAYDMALLEVTNGINVSLTTQLMSGFNNVVGYVFGLGKDFDEAIQEDGSLMKASQTIINNDILLHLNHRLQFLLLYTSRTICHVQSKDQKRQLQQQLDFNDRLNSIQRQKEFILPESCIPKNDESIDV